MKRRIDRRKLGLFASAALCVIGSLLIAACGGAQPQPRRYFSLAPDAPRGARVAEPPTLRVRELDCAPPYDQAGIIFRISPVEVRSYRYASWTAVPGVMISEVLRRYLAASGRFNVVEEEDPAELELGGRVDLIEQVVDEGEWHGRIEVSLTLRRVRDGRIFWRQRIDGNRPAESRDVAEVVAAQSRVLSTALEQELDTLAQAAAAAVAGPPAGARFEVPTED
jgi:ABC-type uncharacterized transport system auxiliary subunit